MDPTSLKNIKNHRKYIQLLLDKEHPSGSPNNKEKK